MSDTIQTHEAATDARAAAPSPEPLATEPAAVADGDDSPGDAGEAAEPTAALDPEAPDRRRIEEQLEALRKRESELRRELAKADHPELAEVIRDLEGSVYRVNRADARLAEGLTKSEQRRRDTVSKKLAALVDKRDKLNAQIAELEVELEDVGEERIRAYRDERDEAMQRLVTLLGGHMAALGEAGIDPAELIPELGTWMGEIRALAEQLAAAKA